MFIKLHGVLGQRLAINLDDIQAIQEILDNSKYSKALESGAKSAITVGGEVILVKNSFVQIENILKKVEQIGGAK
jgi:NAD-dependent DNA ligase